MTAEPETIAHDPKPAQPGGDRTPSAMPAPYTLLTAGRFIQQGRVADALPLLEAVGDDLPPLGRLTRLRCLAIAHNLSGQPDQALPLIDRAATLAAQLGAAGEQVRLKAVLAASHAHSGASGEAVRLLRECAQACDDGIVGDDRFHFGVLAELARALSTDGEAGPSLECYERAIDLSQRFGDSPPPRADAAAAARAQRDDGDADAAIVLIQASVAFHERRRLLERVAEVLREAAALYAERRNQQRARRCLVRAAAISAGAERARSQGQR
jgi:tetratricopeptide (TPR) repeat protein